MIPQSNHSGGSYNVTERVISHQGRDRTYTVTHTAATRSGGPRPAVIVLHGTLQNGRSMQKFTNGAIDRAATAAGAITVYPDAVHREWNGARRATMFWRGAKSVDDVSFIEQLISVLIDSWNIDPCRIYIVGFSLGGQMTIRLIHEKPHLIAAAALIAANQPESNNLTAGLIEQPAAAVPLVTVHGTDDPLAPYEGGVVGYKGRFGRGAHLSAVDTAEYFARRNGFTAAPLETWANCNGDALAHANCGVRRLDYAANSHAPVTHFGVRGTGHHVPGASTGHRVLFGKPTREFDSVAAIFRFFDLR